MSDFVEQCRQEWKRLGVPEPLAEEMASDLASDLREAEADGVSAEELLGSSAFDPRSFAATWAAERGIIPQPPSRRNARRRPLVLVAFTAFAATAMIVTALLLLTGEPKVTLVKSTALRDTRARPQPISRPKHKHGRPDRVDPADVRHRRARLRRMAMVEMGPHATTHRPRLELTSRDTPALAHRASRA